MDFNARYKRYKETERFLDQHLLGKALSQMKEDMAYTPDWDNSNEWMELNEAFTFMLDYMKKGMEDKHRTSLFKQLLLRACLLNDKLLHTFRTHSVNDMFHSIVTGLKVENFPSDMASLYTLMEKWGKIMKGVEASPLDDPAGDTTIIKKYEEFYTRLFSAIYTSLHWTNDDLEAALRIPDNEDIYKYDVLLVESAVTLNLCLYYDENKLRFLIAVVRNVHDYSAQARAIAGIVICCFRHASKIRLNNDLVKVLTEDLTENPVYREGMRLLQKELLICKQTDSATRKMDEEIIPAMMKSTYFRPTKFGFQNVDDYMNPKDSDPTGEKENERKDIEKKLREINDMHLNGLDVYMTTFSHLKHFPFFKLMANWFYPFNPYHYAVKGIYFTEGKKVDVISSILKGITFCDSDKYSFSMLLGTIGTMERKIIESQINQGLEGQNLNELLQEHRELQFMLEIRSYLQDLYRFYKLYPNGEKDALFDPFVVDVNFLHNAILKKVVADEDSLLAIAGAVYKADSYEDALIYLQELEKSGCRDASVYQREGYCYQVLHKYKEAVNAYLKADLIKPGEMWTYRQLGYCYRHLRNYGEALKIYLKIEEADPDNKFVLLRTGECLLQEKRYNEARQRFFKVEYNEPRYLPALRAIAWCAFLSGDLERAGKYYDKILDLIKHQSNKLSDEDRAIDYLNAGHTAVADGNISRAIVFYKLYATYSGTRDFHELWEDFPILQEKYRCERIDMQLIIEAVKSEL